MTGELRAQAERQGGADGVLVEMNDDLVLAIDKLKRKMIYVGMPFKARGDPLECFFDVHVGSIAEEAPEGAPVRLLRDLAVVVHQFLGSRATPDHA